MKHVIEEIGSEFWVEDVITVINDDVCHNFRENGFNGDNRLLLSGRTAIDFICQDLSYSRNITTVYMPAYCCDSMIFPFKNRDVNVLFYDLVYEDGRVKCDIDTTLNVDILYICNYFGFSTGVDVDVVVNMQKKGVIVLYDRTHDLFNNKHTLSLISDYTFCSLRKWVGIPTGAIVSKKNGNFFQASLKECDFSESKYKGMRMKYDYLQGNAVIDKEDFLRLFTAFNKRLSDNYQNYSIDKMSLRLLYEQDFELVRTRRQQNAKLLYDGLSKLNNISVMFQYEDDSVPLFVPILVKKEIRNSLRDYLVSNKVYCPVHWPKSHSLLDLTRADIFYDRELSLVCDQRYHERQMRRIVDLIKNYCNRINI